MTKRIVRNVSEYAAHARAIAKAFNVQLVERDDIPTEGGAAAVMTSKTTGAEVGRAAFVHPITDECTYAVAMHEIGHMVAPNGALGDTREFALVEERAAWEWAEHYAIDWTAGMEAVKEIGINSYLGKGTWTVPSAKPTPPPPATAPQRKVGAAATFAKQIKWHS